MGLRRRLQVLEGRAAEGRGLFELLDGSTYEYGPDEPVEAFLNWYAKVRAEGEDGPDLGVHPFVANLCKAKEGELERIAGEEGSLIEMCVNEAKGCGAGAS